jgi:hypothetical protein
MDVTWFLVFPETARRKLIMEDRGRDQGNLAILLS